MDKVKFAVIGCGHIGSRHLAVIDAEPRAKLVSICDIEIKKCKEYSAQYNVPYFLDYLELIQESDVDIVNICTPHGLHAPMAIDIAEVGKNILVEKPMALSVVDVQDMINAAHKNDVDLILMMQNRHNVPIRITKKVLDENKLGDIYMVQCNVFWNRHQGYYTESTWRGSKELEGGALYTQVSHFVDLMIWWFGEIVDARADIATKNHDIEIEDCGNALLTFESGVMGNLLWTNSVFRKNYEGSITIVGEKGTIKIGGKYLNEIVFWDIDEYPMPTNIRFNDKPNNYGKYQGTSSNHDVVVKNVVAKYLGERYEVIYGSEGKLAIEAIDLIYRNSKIIKK